MWWFSAQGGARNDVKAAKGDVMTWIAGQTTETAATPGPQNLSRRVSRGYAAALAAVIAPFVMPGQAHAGCDQPNGVNNVTVNCTGTTSPGFGVGTETGVTINVAPNAQILSPAVAISILQGTVNNGVGALINGDQAGIGGGVGPIVLTVNNSGEILTHSISSIAAIAGDRVTVTNTGSISGLTGSVGIQGATSATVDNSGGISGDFAGIDGGVVNVTNRASGVITSGVNAVAGDTVTINNDGVILSSTGNAVTVRGGVGKITNTASGLIEAHAGPGILGIGVATTLSIDNAGTISSADNDHVAIFAPGLNLTNRAGGLITAGLAGAGGNTANITNSGTITVTSQAVPGFNPPAAIFGGDVTVNNTATGIISATGPSGVSGPSAISVTTAHVTNDGQIIGTNTVDSTGIILGSGTITNNRSGTISGAVAISAVDNTKGTTIFNSGTIASNQGPNGIAISLTQAGDTVTLTNTSRVIGKIDFGDLAHLGNDVLNIANIAVISAKPSSLTTLLTPADVLANVINFFGTVNSSAAVVDAGGRPFVVNGNQVAVLDPTALSQQDRTLLDFTGGVSTVVTGRLNGNIAQSSGMMAMSYSADAEASSALGYASAANGGAQSKAMADARAQMLTKAPTASWNAAPITVWSSGFGGVRNLDAGSVTLASQSAVAGGIIGVDRRIRPDWLVGLFAGGGTSNLSVSDNSQKVDTDYVFAGAYSRFEWGSQFLDTVLQVGSTHNFSARTVLDNGAPETGRASYNGWFVSPEVAYGYRLNVGNGYVLTPTARVRYLAGSFDGYQESITAETLSVGSRQLSNFEERGELELSRITSFFGGDHQLRASFHAGVIAQQRVGAGNINAILIGQGLTFATPGGNTTGGVFGSTFDYHTSRNVSLFGGVEATAFADSSHSIAGRGGLRVDF
jgi:uncharacterized protein with beta-barrel porin domain